MTRDPTTHHHALHLSPFASTVAITTDPKNKIENNKMPTRLNSADRTASLFMSPLVASFTLALALFTLPAASSPLPHEARAFTRGEFAGTYQLLAQYKHAAAPSCPLAWRYTGPAPAPPSVEGGAYVAYLKHRDIWVSRANDSATFARCKDDGGAVALLSSVYLEGARLADFVREVGKDADKAAVFASVQMALAGRSGGIFYVAAGVEEPMCGEGLEDGGRFSFFGRDDMLLFFDESRTMEMHIVVGMKNGGPRYSVVSLLGDVRYMIATRSGSTCIYRVESDMSDIINGVERPSDSPSPAPKVRCRQRVSTFLFLLRARLLRLSSLRVNSESLN